MEEHVRETKSNEEVKIGRTSQGKQRAREARVIKKLCIEGLKGRETSGINSFGALLYPLRFKL